MKKINSKQTGKSIMTPLQGAASVILGSAMVLVVAGAHLIGLHIYGVLFVMLMAATIVGVVFFTIILDKTVFYRHVTYIKFVLRRRRGEGSIHSFALPLDKLKRHIPIEKIHEDGLIEYDKRQYGIICRYDPPPVTKTESDGFHKQMEYIANSFPPGVEASFHFYNMIDRTNPLADTVLRELNVEGKTLEQKEHLHGMYEYATTDDLPMVSTAYLLAVKLGTFKNIDQAMLAYRSTVPGMMKALRERGIYAIQLTGTNEIAITFREFAVMERYQ